MANGDGSADSGNASGDIGDKIRDIFGAGATVVDPAEAGRHGASGGTPPGDAGGGGASDGAPRGRGRPRGSKNARPRSHDLDISGVEKLLYTIHYGLATIADIAELAIAEDEASKMAVAVARVARHYPMLDKISDKSVDHANLFTCLAGVYGLRFMAYKMRRAQKPAPQQHGDNVTTLRPDPAGNHFGL